MLFDLEGFKWRDQLAVGWPYVATSNAITATAVSADTSQTSEDLSGIVGRT